MATSQQIIITFIIITVILCYLVYQQSVKISYQQLNNKNETNYVQNETTTIENNENIHNNKTNNITKTIDVKKEEAINSKPLLNSRFPQCYVESIKYSELSEILYELYLSSDSCVGISCYSNIKNLTKRNITTKETTGLVMTYIAVGILFIGLIAAFLEVVKAKQEIKVQNKKPELTRRCSLAELNVLRHSRMEMMVRRDSTITEETTKRVPLGTIGRKMSRPRLRVT